MAPVTTDPSPTLTTSQKQKGIQGEDNPAQAHPAMKKTKEKNTRGDLPLSNTFSTLSNDESRMDQDEIINKDDENTLPGNFSTKNKCKFPPLVLHGKINNHKQLVEKLSEITNEKFHLKYHKNSTSFFVKNEHDWNQVNMFLREQSIDYQTYTRKDKKTHAFVQ
ncbi:hypothetical protein WA026_020203 [Henosepilachna vigintioctopunctata]|uniref:Uncharacterized protein n=1 Tax=Henosepilachna vigintioctopunctata TaxID=420089 RepID=A0AAW1UBI9_9CUCU